MNTFNTLDLLTIPLEGMNLIEASAGTGKTFTIANVYLRLILEKDLDVNNLLVVTFTDAATKELKDRIRKNLNKAYSLIDCLDISPSDDEAAIIQEILKKTLKDDNVHTVKLRIKKAVINFDESAIFTIHSFCKRTLNENSFESAQFFDTELISNQGELIQDIADDFWRKNFSKDDIVLGAIAKMKNLNPSSLISLGKETLNKPLLKIIPDPAPFSKQTMLDLFGNDLEKFNLCKDELSDEQSKAISDFTIYMKHEYVSYLKKELYQQKKLSNIQYFDDLLLDLHQVLRSDKGIELIQTIRKDYKAALIDEFQDTDPVQYEIFNTLFNTKGHVLFLIGDPKQAIYGFRGADVFSYIEAASKTDNDKKYTLKKNFRSETNLIEGVNTLFEGSNPFVLSQSIDYHDIHADPKSKGNREALAIEGDDPSNIILWFLKNKNPDKKNKNPNKDEAAEYSVKAVVYEISRILKLSSEGKAKIGNRPVLPSDIAILVTQHKDADRFVKAFSGLNIPIVLQKTGNIFSKPEAKELKMVLFAISSPGNIRKVNAALATSFIGCTSTEIQSFIESDNGFEQYEKHIERFSRYLDIWNKQGFIQMFRKWLSEYQVRQKLLNFPDGERRLTNLLHLSELLHTAAVENRFGVSGLLYWFIDQKNSDEQNEDLELRLERDDEAIKILTVFKSKGLEYPIVFSPFMWQRGSKTGKNIDIIFHDKGDVYLDIGSQDFYKNSEKAVKEKLSELMRILYVAVTRAKNRCYLTCGKIGNPAANSLDYLFLRQGLNGDNIIESLLGKLKSFTEENIHDAIEECIKDLPYLKLDFPIEANSFRYKPISTISADTFVPKKFNKRINTSWGITSYSRLIATEKERGSESLKNDESLHQPDNNNKEIKIEPKDFFSFPRGRVPGSCIHSIFEKLDFTCKNDSRIKNIIQTTLKSYGLCGDNDLESKERVGNVYEMVNQVLKASLMSKVDGLTLSQLSKKDILCELAFYYPLKKLTSETLRNLFSDYIISPYFNYGELPEKIEELSFKPIEGYMQGGIDLVFQWQGKFYILDWKTNHLGNTYEDYSKDKIAEAMWDHLYILQYLIYSVALHKYLSARLPDYCYDKHFGGVFYLFVRGVNAEISGNGIFYDLPSKNFINEFSKLCG